MRHDFASPLLSSSGAPRASAAALIGGLLLFSACGKSTENAAPEASTGSEVSVAAVAPGGSGAIPRERLSAVLDEGLGRFLTTVQTEPHRDESGEFVGFRVVAFAPDAAFYSSIDLLPGDVVTRVNGATIERPEQAFAVWDGLRVSSQLWVEYLRDGRPRELRLSITD